MFKNLFKGGAPNEEDMKSVKIGDRFFQVGGASGWVVEKIFNPIVSDVPHAVIVRDEENDSKIISLSALLDTDIFRYERRNDEEKEVEKVNKLRRKTDDKITRK